MSRHLANLPNLVIANGATAATTPITAYLDDAKTITLVAPATLTGTVTIRGSVDGGVTYVDAGSGGSDITIGAGNAVTLTDPAFNAISVLSSIAEGAERIFQVIKSFEVSR